MLPQYTFEVFYQYLAFFGYNLLFIIGLCVISGIIGGILYKLTPKNAEAIITSFGYRFVCFAAGLFGVFTSFTMVVG